jgi:tetratricopeptide (TPR) repeat protein
VKVLRPNPLEDHRNRGRWIATLLATLLAAAPSLADPLINAREGWRLVEAAKAAMLSGDEARSAALTRIVLEQQDLPNRLRAEALLTRCAATVHGGRYSAALPDCDGAEALGGRSWRIDGIRGMAHLGRGDADGAVEAFQDALREDPQPPILRRGLRAALRARRVNEEARGGYAFDMRLSSLVR